MRKVILAAGALAFVALVGLNLRAADDPKPIKEIMGKAHKDGLLKKVSSGKASDDEKKELLALYEDLAKNKPPMGDEADWKTKTEAMVKAAKAVVDTGDKKSQNALAKTVNCAACHKLHKPAT